MKARLLTWTEVGLWVLAVATALAFVAIRLRNWEPILQMEQTDYAVYYQAARASRVDATALFHIERWHDLTGLTLPIVGPFPYTPTLVLLFWPLSYLPYSQSQQVWLLINVLLMAATFLILWWGAADRRLGLLGALLWLLLPANLDTAYLGNINLLLTLGVTLGVWAYARPGRAWQFLGGISIGGAASLKYFPLGLLIMAAWDRRWRFGLGLAAGFLLFTFVGLSIVGWAAYDEWLRMLLYYGRELAPPGGTIMENQSLFGFFQKLAYGGNVGLTFHEAPLGDLSFQPLLSTPAARVSALTIALLLGGSTLYALWRMERRHPLAAAIAWTLVLVNMVMLSPISWKPYVTIIAPIFPALLLMRQEVSPAWRMLVPLGYLIVLVQRGYVFWLPYIPLLALSSIMVFAYLAWWAVGMRCAWQVRPAPNGRAARTVAESAIAEQG